MKETSPIISLLPLVGVGEDSGWPPGIVRGDVVFKQDAVTVWSGKSEGQHVAVTTLENAASDGQAAAFLEAAQRLEAAQLPGVLSVTAVDPKGRWVVHSPVLGPLADFPGLGWKLKRKLEFFSTLCGLVSQLHERDVAHGALNPWSIALEDTAAMGPVLVSAGGAALWPGGHEYLAPELLMGAAPTQRSDVYSLGRVLTFLLLASHPPFEQEEVPRLDYLGGSPAGLGRIIRRATLADSNLRYPSVAELLSDIRNYGDLEKVGLELSSAIELNKTGMSQPPKATPRRDIPVVRAAPATYVAPTKPPRTRLLAGLVVVMVVLGAFGLGLGDPGFQAFSKWRAQQGLGSQTPAEKGQALAKLAGLGERDLGAMNLVGADLSGCPLTGVSLVHADLSNAKLDIADFGEANLTGAVFTGASAFGTNLSTTDVTDAQGLDTVVCDGATLPPAGWRCPNGHLERKDEQHPPGK